MAHYTTDTELLRELPATLPESLDTEAERAPFIQSASALADALVGPRFMPRDDGQKFPDADDTPATPPLVAFATCRLAASFVYDVLAGLGDETKRIRAGELFDIAVAWFARIRSGEVPVIGVDGQPWLVAPVIVSTTQYAEPVFERDTDAERPEMPTLDEF